jgi:hypothetical protein
MLKAVFCARGESVDFSEMSPSEALKQIVTGRDLTLFIDDFTVLFSFSTGIIAALSTWDPHVDIKGSIPVALMSSILALAIDDEQSYDGIEEFFEDFLIRFVP